MKNHHRRILQVLAVVLLFVVAVWATINTFDEVRLNILRFQATNSPSAKTVTVIAPSTLSTSWQLTWPLNDGTSGQFLTTDGSGVASWTTGGGGGTPGGSNTQVQYNNAGAFGGVSGFTSDGTNVTAGSGNLRATLPQITTGLNDSAGNREIAFTATGSAVNFLTAANSATGSGPVLSAAGSDADVQLNLSSKGLGFVNVTGITTIAANGPPNLNNALTVTALESSIALVLAGTHPTTVVSGNGTDAANLMNMLGPIGGDTSTTTADRNGGKGGGYELSAGPGGQQTGASSGTSHGGIGGEFVFISGNGGAATSGTGGVAGGNGGVISLTTGTGGASASQGGDGSHTNPAGGSGGLLSLTGGAGGIATVAGGLGISGNGGSVVITGGAGGNRTATDGASGNGGSITLVPGAAGTPSGGASSGSAGTVNVVNAITFLDVSLTPQASIEFEGIDNLSLVSAGGLVGGGSLELAHLIASGNITTSIASGFGAGAAIVNGSDTGGRVNVGTTPGTSGVLTFGLPYLNAPACTANNESTAVLVRATATTTTLTLSGVFVNSDLVTWVCIGN